MNNSKSDIKACVKLVQKEQRSWSDKRGKTFGIMVGKDHCAVQYQRRVRLLVRLHYRLHPNLIPDSLCLVCMRDKEECPCQTE